MPNRISRLLVSLLIAPLMVLVVGCPKKLPQEPAATTAPSVGEKAAPATDVPSGGFEETTETPSSLDEQDEALRKLNAQKVLGTIYFEFNKSDLSSEALEQLRKNAQWLKTNSKYRVRIEGNCDDRGTVEYNLALGERRATAAKSYLVKAGIDGSRIETISYGEEHPVDPGHNEEAWLKNRRDDFVVIR